LCLYFKRRNLISFLAALKQNTRADFLAYSKAEKIIFIFIIGMLTAIFIQGIIYPPNNWDAMTYHLARIPHWIDNKSVEHYPTHIFRQIYQPPFAEYVIMHVNVLSAGDYLSNSVQFFFLIFSISAIVLLIDAIGLPSKFKLISVALLVTIPQVVLQASSTQNDLVLSFFILTSVYYSITSLRQPTLQNYFFLGLSIGLGLLTKGTGYLYLIPITSVFGFVVIIRLFKTKNYTGLRYSIYALLICISINIPLYARNYNLSKNILGIDSEESKKYKNEKMSPILFLSSIIKNAGKHIGPFPINKISNIAIRKIHLYAGIDIDDPATNLPGHLYSGALNFTTNENIISNSIHFYLITLSFILNGIFFFRHRKARDKLLAFLSLMIILQTALFCYYLKLQPWATRLETPFFMLCVPLICYTANLKKIYLKILQIIIIINIAYASFIIMCNNTRPFWTNRYTVKINITDDRFKKYFADRLNVYEEYDSIAKDITISNYRNIGLILGEDDYEYPLFNRIYSKEINPIHICVTNNISKKIPQQVNSIDCVVSTVLNDSLAQFNGKKYFNKNRKNKLIWLYTPNG
jgi:hypothetical protein